MRSCASYKLQLEAGLNNWVGCLFMLGVKKQFRLRTPKCISDSTIIRPGYTQRRRKCDEAGVSVVFERERACRIAGTLLRGDTDTAVVESEGRGGLALECTWLAAHLHEPDTQGVLSQ